MKNECDFKYNRQQSATKESPSSSTQVNLLLYKFYRTLKKDGKKCASDRIHLGSKEKIFFDFAIILASKKPFQGLNKK